MVIRAIAVGESPMLSLVDELYIRTSIQNGVSLALEKASGSISSKQQGPSRLANFSLATESLLTASVKKSRDLRIKQTMSQFAQAVALR